MTERKVRPCESRASVIVLLCEIVVPLVSLSTEVAVTVAVYGSPVTTLPLPLPNPPGNPKPHWACAVHPMQPINNAEAEIKLSLATIGPSSSETLTFAGAGEQGRILPATPGKIRYVGIDEESLQSIQEVLPNFPRLGALGPAAFNSEAFRLSPVLALKLLKSLASETSDVHFKLIHYHLSSLSI